MRGRVLAWVCSGACAGKRTGYVAVVVFTLNQDVQRQEDKQTIAGERRTTNECHRTNWPL
jgi:hypothetical protein